MPFPTRWLSIIIWDKEGGYPWAAADRLLFPAGQNFVGGGFCELEVGNTELAAEVLRVLTRADIFRIEPERDYGPDFCRCMDQVR